MLVDQLSGEQQIRSRFDELVDEQFELAPPDVQITTGYSAWFIFYVILVPSLASLAAAGLVNLSSHFFLSRAFLVPAVTLWVLGLSTLRVRALSKFSRDAFELRDFTLSVVKSWNKLEEIRVHTSKVVELTGAQNLYFVVKFDGV